MQITEVLTSALSLVLQFALLAMVEPLAVFAELETSPEGAIQPLQGLPAHRALQT